MGIRIIARRALNNYPLNAQAPNNKINKDSVITELKNSTAIGWVLVEV